MNSVVVYDSQFGNTERVAQVVARALDQFGSARAGHIHETGVALLHDVDLLVFGCPMSGIGPGSHMRLFVERLPVEVLRRPQVACFDTRPHLPRLIGRFAAPQLARMLKHLGVEPIVPPEGFYVVDRHGPLDPGEVERAAEWAKGVGLQASQARVGEPGS